MFATEMLESVLADRRSPCAAKGDLTQPGAFSSRAEFLGYRSSTQLPEGIRKQEEDVKSAGSESVC
jgi:hypothetical protein